MLLLMFGLWRDCVRGGHSQTAFEGMTGIAIMQRVAHEEMRVNLPSDHIFAPLLNVCLSSDPHARPSFAQAHEMLNQL
mgnify:CR=1 FL=1